MEKNETWIAFTNIEKSSQQRNDNKMLIRSKLTHMYARTIFIELRRISQLSFHSIRIVPLAYMYMSSFSRVSYCSSIRVLVLQKLSGNQIFNFL